MNSLDVATTIKATLRRLTQTALPKAEDVWVCQQLGQSVEAAAWRRAFEAEGTLKAQTLNFRTPQLNRLMVAQAVLVPDSVVEFCQWLAKSSTTEKEAMWAWLDAYVEGLNQPFRVHKWELIAAVLDKKLNEAMFALLISKPVWGPAEVFCVQFERWSKADTAPHPSLAPVWQYRAQRMPDPSYAPFRKALQRANIPAPQRLVALIMQIEQGHVSPDVFEQAFPEAIGRSNRVRYLGFEIVATKPTAWVGQQNVLRQALQGVGEVVNGFFQLRLAKWLAIALAGSAVLALLLKVYSRFDVLPGASAIAQLPLIGRSTPEPIPSPTPTPSSTPSPARTLLDRNLYSSDSYQDDEMSITVENIREITRILNSLADDDYVVKLLSYLDTNDLQSTFKLEVSSNERVIELLNEESISGQNNSDNTYIPVDQDVMARRLLYQAIYEFQQWNPQVRSDELEIDRERFPNGMIVSISEGTGRYLMCAIAIEEGFAVQFIPPCPDDVGELR